MSKLRPAVVALALTVASAALLAQDSQAPSGRVEFDVVSIKRSALDVRGGGGRSFPDGSQRMTNMPIRNFILAASPVPTREVIGLPDWAMTERYDVELKAPPGATVAQRRQMMQAMFADRMKLIAHVEQRERDVYSLVLARSDGKLGPELKPSPNDCSPPPPGTPPPAPRTSRPTEKEILSRCGMMMSAGTIISGGVKLDNLAASITGIAGGEVTNDTGLDGFYAFTLKFSPPRNPVTSPDPVIPAAALPDDAQDIFTAVQDQLGLKLVHGKKMMPVFVVDYIERPTEN